MKKLTSLFCSVTLFFPTLCAEKELREQEMPFQLVGDHLIVVKASAQGLPRLRLVIDTGATRSLISRRVVKKLGLKKYSRSTPVHAFGKTESTQRVILQQVRLGPILTTMVCFVADLSGRWSGFDAIVGMDLLHRQNLTIDYTRMTIRFGSREHFQAVIPFRLDAGNVVVELHTADENLQVVVDTGAPTLVLDGDKTKTWLSGPVMRLPKEIGFGGGVSIRRTAWLRGARLGASEWKKLRTLLFYMRSGYPRPKIRRETDGVLGPVGLKLRRVYFDFANHQLSWET